MIVNYITAGSLLNRATTGPGSHILTTPIPGRYEMASDSDYVGGPSKQRLDFSRLERGRLKENAGSRETRTVVGEGEFNSAFHRCSEQRADKPSGSSL